jgi:hypothetical protein
MLQPLRHLLAAAAVPRVLEIRDVDSDEILNLYVRVGLVDGNELVIKTPHVLPPYGEIQNLKIDDPAYFAANFAEFPYQNDRVRPIIWLKKRSPAESPRISDIETLRTVLCMSRTDFLALESESNDRNYLEKTRLELEWDSSIPRVIEYLRADSVHTRTCILAEEPRIRDFLVFHGIFAWATIKEACESDAAVTAHLIPFFSHDELQNLLF